MFSKLSITLKPLLNTLEISVSFSSNSRIEHNIPKVLNIRSQTLLNSTSQKLFYPTALSYASTVFTRLLATTLDWKFVSGWCLAKKAQDVLQIHCFPSRGASFHTQTAFPFLTYDFRFGLFRILDCVSPSTVQHSFHTDLHRQQAGWLIPSHLPFLRTATALVLFQFSEISSVLKDL